MASIPSLPEGQIEFLARLLGEWGSLQFWSAAPELQS